ncbi:SPFH domain-containing protein [Fructobacillus ficulneus]|uniref:Membrane protease family stomatin/prohibitin-like protein n=1 Tax=Fructobacillus ficulneus TaxID=157463 RepID=A0A0K8MIT9_9LACO|nr:SPFH domain-containing protein [Fructobacillus ficulneus]GAP00451.1 membrane protease family stomatin/prohibitin-like protein [Fructobacillus ficulneus]
MILIPFIIVIVALSFRIVPQNCVGLLETLGKYSTTRQTGLNFRLPLIQKIRVVSLALQPLKLAGYSVITKDNADIGATVTLNFHITDPVKYSYENTNSIESMQQLVRGHLRDIIGRMDLNQALGSTSQINKDLATAIGDLTNTYGINVDRINIDELKPSAAIQASMDTQLKADRERVAAISQAQGEAKSIELRAQANNEALIATATANAQATKTRADAESYRIDKVQAALKNADQNYFNNQSINAFEALANSDTNLVVTNGQDLDQTGQNAVLAKMLGRELKD